MSSDRAPSSRASLYSLQTLSRPSSVVQHPIPISEGQLAPPRSQESKQAQSSDEFLPQEVDRYDRIWGDMATRMRELDTVTTRPATDMRVVSEAHAKRVDQLRDAQIRLAEAWEGSESRLDTNQGSLLAKLANSAAGNELTEVSDEERSRMNDQIFQQMELEVGIVMGRLEEVIRAQVEVDEVSRDMWRSTISIAQDVDENSGQRGHGEEGDDRNS